MVNRKNNKRVVEVKETSLASFEGTFAAILGLGVAILHSLRTTVNVADSTNSVVSGMALGLATGVISILVLPFIYFAIGWIVGLVHAWVFNVVLGASGGLVFNLEDE